MKKRNIRVLVVDDFKAFRQWVSTFLGEHGGFEVAGEAANAKEAFQKAQELVPDLVLLDVGLPDGNGLEVGKQICGVAPSAKIVFLSAWADRDVVQSALRNGAKGYVLKSDAPKELLPAITVVLNGGTFVKVQSVGAT